MILRVASFADLDTRTLLAILKLRADVFVVEQRSPYPDIDGQDDAPTTLHLWLDDGGAPAAYLRLLTDPDGSARIGRVVTAASHRGQGLAGRLMTAALERVPAGVPCVLNAQTHLARFYEAYGFAVCGPEFDDDGIPHVPMRRSASSDRAEWTT
jgi:ElaA protein